MNKVSHHAGQDAKSGGSHSHDDTMADEVWLQIYNKERRKENSGEISGELFEAIIDQLEKEWFNLVSLARHMPPPTRKRPATDFICLD